MAINREKIEELLALRKKKPDMTYLAMAEKIGFDPTELDVFESGAMEDIQDLLDSGTKGTSKIAEKLNLPEGYVVHLFLEYNFGTPVVKNPLLKR